MSAPNWLTANASGIELMPGVNDNAVGYDVNRIIQALNGTNLVPITTGNLTVTGNETISGTLMVTGLTTLTGGVSVSSITGPVTITGLLTTQNSAPGINFNYTATAAGSGAAPTLPANTPTGATGGTGKWVQVQLGGVTAYVLVWQ